jgi:hypothetical protein
VRTRVARFLSFSALGLTALCASDAAAWPEGEETVIELHFTPVPNAQIAVWLTDADGAHIRDVFLTQATGLLGIGNRSGIWNFLSSWRAPYGPRKSVLPVWAHARGGSYPKIIFHDDQPGHETSLGFHEQFSSAEPFHCRPLLPNEHEAILDSMTCPSPSTFRTDKGRFDPGGESSVYPPRGDIGTFDPDKDHVDTQMYGELNDLDAVSAATPAGNTPAIVTLKLTDEELALDALRVWVEVNIEADENSDWDFDRDTDHFVDPLLSTYGVEWLGQPSVVYSVQFSPSEEGTWMTSDYEGYGSWDGSSGDLNPPDATISNSGGSGADRLKVMQGFDSDFRLAVHTGEGGSCASMDLPPVEDVSVTPINFDTVEIGFTIPEELPPGVQIRHLEVKYDVDATAESYDGSTAVMASPPILCAFDQLGVPIIEGDCLAAMPGSRVEFQVASLFGNYDYAFAMAYSDQCANTSDQTLGSTRTPAQDFQQVDTFCFVATAAYGAHWGKEVWALRRFRDQYLAKHEVGRALISTYYAYGPTVAKQIHASPLLRAAARGVLTPLAVTADAISPI